MWLGFAPSPPQRAPKKFTKDRRSPCRQERDKHMSKAKNAQYSTYSPMGENDAPGAYVCRLPLPFVAQSIQRDPSFWVEMPLPGEKNFGTEIYGSNIQCPVLGTEYSIGWTWDDVGHEFFVHFLSYLHSLASVRLFLNKHTGFSYVCTDACDEIMKTVLSLVQQTLEQKLDSKTLKTFRIYHDGER